MRLFRLFGITTLILSAVILGSCTVVKIDKSTEQTDTKEVPYDNIENENEQDKAQEMPSEMPETENFGKMGWAVDTDDSSYYWEFTGDDFESGALWGNFGQSENSPVSLMCKKSDGSKSTVLETESAHEFAVTGDKIFYTEGGKISYLDSGSGQKNSLDIAGEILGVTDDGKYLVYTFTNEEYKKELYTLYTSDMSVTKIYSGCDFIAVHNGKIYYSPIIEDYESASLGEIKLCSSNADGTGFCQIYHSFADLYDYPAMSSPCNIAQIRFTDEYIYFSYGAVAGSGVFYQGGNIVRVRYDGSGAKTLYTSSDENFIDSEFTINPDGSVTALDVIENDSLYSFQDKYITRDGSIYWFDDVTGTPTDICSYYPEDSYDLATANFVNVTKKHAFFVTHYCTYTPEKNMGWRDFFEREKSIFYMIDRESGEIVTSYEF